MFKFIFFPILALLFLISFFLQNNKGTSKAAGSEVIIRAQADLKPTQGNKAKGKVTFTEEDKGIKVTADIEGLAPGKHGFHIHETGDCSAPDGSSAGGHFNPYHKNHGAPADSIRHAGDLGNLDADLNGKAHLEWLDTLITLEGENSIIGRSVIVHENPDDYKTQPTGNAGRRLACGLIYKEK